MDEPSCFSTFERAELFEGMVRRLGRRLQGVVGGTAGGATGGPTLNEITQVQGSGKVVWEIASATHRAIAGLEASATRTSEVLVPSNTK